MDSMERTILKKLWRYKIIRTSTWYFAITTTLTILIMLVLLCVPGCQRPEGCLTGGLVGLTVDILVALFISALVLLVALELPDKWMFVLPKLALFLVFLAIVCVYLPLMLVAVSWYAHGGNPWNLEGS
jgi:hypothetical protein